MACSRLILSPALMVVEEPLNAVLLDGLLASGVIWILHMTAERLGLGLDA
jgi:hypothetical protein